LGSIVEDAAMPGVLAGGPVCVVGEGAGVLDAGRRNFTKKPSST
jgi:hypothetical protein